MYPKRIISIKNVLFTPFIVLLLVGCAEDLFNDVGNNDNGENYNPVPSFGADSTFEVITWNVEWFPKHLNTVNAMAEIIVDLNADIFGLQEITNTSYFNQLIDKINDLDSLNQWIGFRAENGDYQELAYIINTSSVTIINNPYSILNSYSYYYAYRNPYVVEVSYTNNNFIIINNHFKCCGNGNLEIDDDDEEYRRQLASNYLKNYVDNNFPNDNVIIIGDLNDKLDDSVDNNVFQNFIQDNTNYQFVDINIALGESANYSWPGWNQNTYPPTHLDHIIITNEIFDGLNNFGYYVQTICLDEYLNTYYQYISDHRPVGLSLVF